MGYKLCANITCLNPIVLRKILQNIFITKKCTQLKTLHTLKTDAFVLTDNKNIGKLFSKYALFSLDQANFRSYNTPSLEPPCPLTISVKFPN